MNWLHHLIVLPILLPLVTGAVLIPADERNRTLKGVVGFASTMSRVRRQHSPDAPGGVGGTGESGAIVYLLGNWPAPFGIVLVLDRLSALMLVLTFGAGARRTGVCDGANGTGPGTISIR